MHYFFCLSDFFSIFAAEDDNKQDAHAIITDGCKEAANDY